MMQTFSVPLSSFPQNEIALTEQLDEILSSSYLADISTALIHENKEKFGPSVISNLSFEVVSYNLSAQTGRVRFWYDMQLTFGCEDLVKDHKKQHSYYNFIIDSADLKISFRGDEQESRSTADEF
ncbi:hypothetical protein FPZ43_08270 [Mucilaginibacter pallidiroseus]|uniref:Uncharacterized protein n=1 Tax=Mucilaginibacter pallidiroseus TaxID=2599295 RepID=A0A563UEQ5_9SPHI|nr:hypothetical protein [Mucilaginibacter pallidiroseus]TWR29840.1 hypothetical protein FPZ43_08270 [Mucilaginibacter pallidiroseus]